MQPGELEKKKSEWIDSPRKMLEEIKYRRGDDIRGESYAEAADSLSSISLRCWTNHSSVSMSGRLSSSDSSSSS